MAGMTLKPDAYIKIETNRGTREPVKKPLTEEQRQFLIDNYGKKAAFIFKYRYRKSALASDFDEDSDLLQYGWSFFYNILDKFDLAECGEIGEFDEPGADKPKTLIWYFNNYYSLRVNFAACESRNHKNNKHRKVGGPAEYFQEITYDEEDTNTSFSNQQYEITGHIEYELEKLKKNDELAYRFFIQKYKMGLSLKELRKEYDSVKFKELHNKVKKLIEVIKRNYKNDYLN